MLILLETGGRGQAGLAELGRSGVRSCENSVFIHFTLTSAPLLPSLVLPSPNIVPLAFLPPLPAFLSPSESPLVGADTSPL